jgi:flagellar assembly protein FliH
MVKPVKFTFDTPFDEPQAAAPAEEPPPPVFTLEDVEAARAEAHAAGRAAGEADAMDRIEARVAEASGAIEAALARLLARQTGELAELRADAGEIAYAVASKLAPTLIARTPLAEVEAMVEHCLGEIAEEPRVVVRIADALVGELKERIDGLAEAAGFPGQVVLLGDPTLAPGDARVEWAHGGAERNQRTVAAAVDAAVGRYIQSLRSE